MNIIHKPIENYENYEIYSDGKIWSNKTKKFLKPSIDKWGYSVVGLRKDNHTDYFKVHRLVANAFIQNPNPDCFHEINHKDENKINNSMDNLEWCDRKYNQNYGTRTEKTSKKIICIETNEVFLQLKTLQEKKIWTIVI